MITKKDIINYLIDCKGYNEEEARKIISLHRYTEYLSGNDLIELEEFSK